MSRSPPEEGVLFHGVLPDPLGGRWVSAVQLDLCHCRSVIHVCCGTVSDAELPPLVGDLDNVGPGKVEDFCLVSIYGNPAAGRTDQDQCVVLIL